MILSMVNVKGGVGKTTTAVNLAAAFAGTGLKVLIIDLDPQGSASFSLGVPYDETLPSVYGALLEDRPLAELVRPTRMENVSLVTGSMDLAGADLKLARKKDPQLKLARAVAGVRRAHDVILIDCPPGLSLLTVNGLAASKAYLVPVVPHDLSMEALGRFAAAVDALGLPARHRPQELGILLTMVDHRTNLTDAMVAELRKAYGRRILGVEIPVNVKLAEAPGYGLSIFQYEGWSTGAQAYRRLGGEVLKRARQRKLL